jgi:hypothetical protein
MPLRNPEMEEQGLSVEVSAELCDAVGGLAKSCAGLSGVVIGSTNDGCSVIQLTETSAERRYRSKLAEWERDQHSVWSALRARPKPEYENILTVFSGVLKRRCASDEGEPQ